MNVNKALGKGKTMNFDPYSESEWEKANEYARTIGVFGELPMHVSVMDVYRAVGAPGELK